MSRERMGELCFCEFRGEMGKVWNLKRGRWGGEEGSERGGEREKGERGWDGIGGSVLIFRFS
jgi:hypothetical protein